MPARLTMSFHNGNTYNGPISNLATGTPRFNTAPPRSAALNSSMIDRVHKAKPGCSACGKKVA